MPDMEGCLKGKGPWRFLLEAAALWEKRGDGLGSISNHIGLCSFYNYSFLNRSASGAPVSSNSGGTS